MCVVGLLAAGPAAASTTQLVEAVKNRDNQAVAALLEQHVDVNVPQPDGATALHWAAHWDDLATARRLIGAGARVNAVNDYGVTPLFLACSDGGAPMVAALLEAGANPNIALPNGETALMAAARTGKVEAVKALLLRGADVNAKETLKGQTGLMWAVAENHLEAAKLLIAHGADVNARSNNKSTALLFAAREGNVEIARLLLEQGADVNAADAAGIGVLLMATVRGHVELAHVLLEQGANPNAAGAGFTPLHWAAGKWETYFTNDYSFAPGTTHEWAAVVGLPRGKLDLIQALLAHGADVNAQLTRVPPQSGRGGTQGDLVRGATPFYLAALVGDTDVMRLLRAHGADTRTPVKDGTTPLMAASGLAYHENRSRVESSSYLEAVRLLLEWGADIHAVNEEGWTALHAATLGGQQAVVEYLLNRGANLNARTKFGQTVLGIAEGYCNLRVSDGRILPSAGCIIGYRPAMAEYLRGLGAESEGKVSMTPSGELIVATSVTVPPDVSKP
jgi:ankyrin repeat protein